MSIITQDTEPLHGNRQVSSAELSKRFRLSDAVFGKTEGALREKDTVRQVPANGEVLTREGNGDKVVASVQLCARNDDEGPFASGAVKGHIDLSWAKVHSERVVLCPTSPGVGGKISPLALLCRVRLDRCGELDERAWNPLD